MIDSNSTHVIGDSTSNHKNFQNWNGVKLTLLLGFKHSYGDMLQVSYDDMTLLFSRYFNGLKDGYFDRFYGLTSQS